MNKNISFENQKPSRGKNGRNTSLKVVLIGVNASFSHTNLAIRHLESYCMQNKALRDSVDFIRYEFTINESIRENIASLIEDEADVYGFSCYIWNISTILEMTELLKKLRPGCVIILGGPEVSFEDEEFFSFHPEIDYIIQGPGEKALSDWLTDFLANRNADRFGRKNRRIKGEPVSLDEIPFAYSSKDFAFMQKQYYYETIRGCPFQCSYCLSSTADGMNMLSMERVKEELSFFIQQKIKQVKLVDRTFNCSDRRAMEIWSFLMEKYHQKPFNTNFHFEIAGDLLSQEAMTMLKTAPKGLFQFEIGVQTTNKAVLENIHRQSMLDKLYQNVKQLKEQGNISLHLDLIAGLPGEDWTSFSGSFHDVFSLRPEMLQLGFLKVLKGSPIRSDAEKLGLIYSDLPPYEIVETASMTFHQMNRLKKVEDILERYYNSSLFRYSLEFLLGFFSNSFCLFEQLQQEWEKKGLFKQKCSRQDVIRELYYFGRSILDQASSQKAQEDFSLFVDLLKFDYYCFDKKGNIEELGINFSHHHPSLPRDCEKASWYRPNGQPVCTKPRLEKYTFRANCLLASNTVVPGISYVLYEMGGNRPVIMDVLENEQEERIVVLSKQ